MNTRPLYTVGQILEILVGRNGVSSLLQSLEGTTVDMAAYYELHPKGTKATIYTDVGEYEVVYGNKNPET